MVVILNPKSITGSNQVKLTTLPSHILGRAKRVKEDLDHLYTEADTKARSQVIGLPYIDLYGFPIDTTHLIILSKEEVEQYKIGVFALKNKEVFLATYEPGSPDHQVIFKKLLDKNLKPKVFLCSEFSLKKLIKTYDAIVANKILDDQLKVDLTGLQASKGITLQNLSQILNQISTSEAIETILLAALTNNASDIHFEPEKETYNLRFRLDGVLHTLAQLPKAGQKTIENRIKLLSGLKLNVDNIPQDGRFSFFADREIDVRVSMLPSNYGYSIVMRLLGTGSVKLNLSDLGFTGLAKERILKAIQKPQGLILTTGPTGSGKTTTLYTFLHDLNDGESKIITLEDPVEYKLPGVSQTQIDSNSGYTFASGLRSILRQDPDIVMVGEIRDGETAEIAIQASLTGHQVLSTIHTNDATGAIPRLMEMGIRGFLLADSLSVIIGQRLIRKICPHCKKPDTLTPEQGTLIQNELAKIPASSGITIDPNAVFYTSSGCDKCGGLGYKGRIGVYEVLTVTNPMRELLSNQFPSTQQVKQVATQDGMITMLQDAILKGIEGVSDIKEILKNIG